MFGSWSNSDLTTVYDDQVKLGLFVRNHQAQRIIEEFERILLLPKKRREAWIEENEAMLNNLMDQFTRDSMLVLDGLTLDSETVELSIEFVTNLRDAMNTIKGVLHEAHRLKS